MKPMFEFVTQHEFWAGLLLALLLLASACVPRYTVRPGALNKTDSAVYDALLIAEATIDQARTQLQAGQLPGEAKDALNGLAQACFFSHGLHGLRGFESVQSAESAADIIPQPQCHDISGKKKSDAAPGV